MADGSVITTQVDCPKVLTQQVKTDTTAATDLTLVTGADKTLALDTVVWDDMRVVPGSFDRPGVSDPDIFTYNVNGGGVNTYLYEFDNNDIVSFTIQLPHTYKHGTDIYAHVHWTPGALGSAQNGNFAYWKLDYSWADINGNFGTMETLDLKDACDGTNHKHQMTPDVVIDGHTEEKRISSMLICNLRRTDEATTPWNNAQGLLLLEVDFHFQIDTIGSRQISAK